MYSWFFLINLMKTGIGQWKYCIPQPFSRCLINLCSNLFDFNSVLKQWLCKILGGKQGTLWSMWRWWILSCSCSCGESPRTHFPAVGGHLNGWVFSKFAPSMNCIFHSLNSERTTWTKGSNLYPVLGDKKIKIGYWVTLIVACQKDLINHSLEREYFQKKYCI